MLYCLSHAEIAEIRRKIACVRCCVSLPRSVDVLFPIWAYKNKLLTPIQKTTHHPINAGGSIKHNQLGLYLFPICATKVYRLRSKV